MSPNGRPRIVTDETLTAAGKKLTLPKVTVRAVAAELGVSEMSIYRRVGDFDGLKRIIAEGIVADAAFALADIADPEDALVDIAQRLRTYVQDNPGIGEHLANLDHRNPVTLGRIEQVQTAFAERFDLTPAQASILVSTVSEHAVALASLAPRGHREHRGHAHLQATPTIQSGARAAAALTPDERFAWSIRAAARGAMSLLALHTRTDAPTAPATAKSGT